MVYDYVANFVSIDLFCRPLAAKSPILPFFGLRHLVVSPVGGDLRKLNTNAQLQNLPLSNGIKMFFCIPTFSWRNRAHKLLTFKSATNRQTDK